MEDEKNIDSENSVSEPFDEVEETPQEVDVPSDIASGDEANNTPQDVPTTIEEVTKQPDTKEPLFKIEPKKPGCTRNDKMLLASQKVGFIGLVSFLLLSILFGVIMKYWENALNLLFMGLAVLSYGAQATLHYIAVKDCNCTNCKTSSGKDKIVILATSLAFVLFVVLFALKQFTDIL